MVKIERSFPAPASLESEAKKVSGSYEQPDVVSRLRKDFHDKCYICELKNLQDPQVEHLLPHKNGKYPERKFDWNNLFWSCSHCNGIKNQKKYDDGIIDCCTYKSAMRYNELTKEMNLLYDNLEAYRKNPDSRYIQRKLKALLRRESAFAAFKRNYIRDNCKEFPQLQSYIE